MTFPQFRKLNERAYYKIVSDSEMFEMQKLGRRYVPFHIKAQNFVDRNLILDLLNGDNERYEIISASEYEAIEKERKNSK